MNWVWTSTPSFLANAPEGQGDVAPCSLIPCPNHCKRIMGVNTPRDKLNSRYGGPLPLPFPLNFYTSKVPAACPCTFLSINRAAISRSMDVIQGLATSQGHVRSGHLRCDHSISPPCLLPLSFPRSFAIPLPAVSLFPVVLRNPTSRIINGEKEGIDRPENRWRVR